MSIQYEWDPKKAESNLAKHNVSFEEAVTVFADPLARIFDGESHSVGERREIIIGYSAKQRLVLASFVETGKVIRLVSARKATRLERKDLKKKPVSKKSPNEPDDLRPEYRFDYTKSKPNRFASRTSREAVAVVLDPDVAAVFKSSEAVNELLRSVISAMPESKPENA